MEEALNQKDLISIIRALFIEELNIQVAKLGSLRTEITLRKKERKKENVALCCVVLVLKSRYSKTNLKS